MNTKLNAWSDRVHDYCLSMSVDITVAEAIAMFGRPSSGTPSNLLNSAASAGYFRRHEFQEEGEHRTVTRVRYHPVDKAVKASYRSSWFDGIQRARSVFDLGQQAGESR